MPPAVAVKVMTVPLEFTAARNDAFIATMPDWPDWIVRAAGEKVTPVGRPEKETAMGWLNPL